MQSPPVCCLDGGVFDLDGKELSDKRFESLIDEYGQRVLNVALRVAGNADLAQDVHQEVFLSIWRRWEKFDDQINWTAYLYRATVRKAIRLAKSPLAVQTDDECLESASTDANPESVVCAAELAQELIRCLGKLPRRQAEVFVLSRMERLSHKEIAETLGCAEKTVRVHLHRALKRLAQELSEYFE